MLRFLSAFPPKNLMPFPSILCCFSSISWLMLEIYLLLPKNIIILAHLPFQFLYQILTKKPKNILWLFYLMSLSAYSFFNPAIGECIDPLLLNASELVVFLLFLSYTSKESLFLLPAVCLSRISSLPCRELSRTFELKSYSG